MIIISNNTISHLFGQGDILPRKYDLVISKNGLPRKYDIALYHDNILKKRFLFYFGGKAAM